MCGAAACDCMVRSCCVHILDIAGVGSNAVDLYNCATEVWTTAQLSVGRFESTAASVGSMALFAGGWAKESQSKLRLRNKTVDRGLPVFVSACSFHLFLNLRC
jgi:hypothetical protein